MIHVVTDSTSDLTPDLLQKSFNGINVHVVPLTVHFGEEEFRDGIDLSTSDFYKRLKLTEIMPRTSQPSPASFVDLYNKISRPGDTILSYHLSSELSGTIQSAALAARQVEGRTIEVVDTRSVSFGLGLIAARAATRVKEGMNIDAIIAESRQLIEGHQILFLVDTLQYLQRNGRIGRAAALVGGLLSVKPILTISDGMVTPLEKVRGALKAKERLFQMVNQHIMERNVRTGAVLHADAVEEAKILGERLQKEHPDVQFPVIELGPTVGTHAGPGSIGVVLFAG